MSYGPCSLLLCLRYTEGNLATIWCGDESTFFFCGCEAGDDVAEGNTEN